MEPALVNFAPYDTFGRSSRRQAGYVTAERASRAARAAESRLQNSHSTDGAKLASNPHTPISVRRWEPDTRKDEIGRQRGFDIAGNHVGTVYLESGRLFAMVSYPEPGNTDWVVLPGSHAWNPMGLSLARRAAEAVLRDRAAFLKASTLPAGGLRLLPRWS